MTEARPLIAISWDGASEPLALVQADASPQFDLLVFDYSGASGLQRMGGRLPWCSEAICISHATQCKGDQFVLMAEHLARVRSAAPYVGLIDDDVMISVSAINRLLHIARCLPLHVLSASLSHDSERSHRLMYSQSQRLARSVDWVEVMMPIIDRRVFEAAAPHWQGVVSSWGIDRYLLPAAQQVTGLTKCAIVDSVVAAHLRPITSAGKRFRNGMTAQEEANLLRERAMAWVRSERPDLVGSAWWRRTFESRHTRSKGETLLQGLGRPIKRWLDRSV